MPLPLVTTVACKKKQSFCHNCRWKVTPKHAYTLDIMKSDWAGDVVQAKCGNLWRKQVHLQLVRKCSSTVVSVHYTTANWSWSKTGISVCKLISLKKKFLKQYRQGTICQSFPHNPCMQGKSPHLHNQNITQCHPPTPPPTPLWSISTHT